MKNILVGYITHSGTTRDVAETIAEEIKKTGNNAEVKPLDQAADISTYDAVVLGAPMIIGWHRAALKFLKTKHSELAAKPLAVFLTAMSLTESPRPNLNHIDLHVDPKLVAAPKNPGKLGFKEGFTTFKHYLAPILKVAPKSLSAIAFFGGRLDMYRLKWFDAIFVMLVVGAKPGEKRNWADIRGWAADLPGLFKFN